MLTALGGRLLDSVFFRVEWWSLLRCSTRHAAKFGFQIKSFTTHCQMRYKTSQTYLPTVETASHLDFTAKV